NPPWTKPRLLVWAGPARRPITTARSAFLLNSGSQGSVSGLLRSCGANPAGGASWSWICMSISSRRIGQGGQAGERADAGARRLPALHAEVLVEEPLVD